MRNDATATSRPAVRALRAPRVAGILLMAVWALAIAFASGADPRAEHPRLVASTNGNSLMMSNSRDGFAILSAPGLTPGQSVSGTVTITNEGAVDGDFMLDKANLTDATAPVSQRLSSVLDLTIDDVTTSPAQNLYSGKLGAMPQVAIGTIPKRTPRVYRFTVRFPSGAGATNALQGRSVTVDYLWSEVQAKKK